MRNKSGGKAIIVILLLILLIIGVIAGGAYIYLATDLFKTPEQLFKKYLLSNVIQVAQMNFAPFNEIDERSENEVAEYTLNVGFDPTSMLGETAAEEMGKYDVNLTLTTDIPNRNEELSLLVNKNDKEFLKGSLALTDETFGLSVPDVYDKYVAIENRDLKKIAENLELPEDIITHMPNELPGSLTPEEQEKVNELANKYITQITEQFDENNYIAEKNLKITVNGREILSDRYTISMNSRTMYTAVTTAIKELLEDSEFLALCENRIDSVQLENIKSTFNSLLAETPVEDITDTTINLSVYASEGKTVKTELSVDENEASIIIDNNGNESAIICLVKEPKSETNEVGITATTTIKNIYTDNVGELSYESKKEYNKDDIETLQAEYDAEYSDYTFSNSYSNTFDYSDIYTDEAIKYVLKTTKVNENTITGKVEFESEDLAEMKDVLTIDFKCKFGAAKVTTLNTDNAVIINDYAKEDYQKLILEIMTNLSKLSLEKPDSLIGSLMQQDSSDDEDIYSSDGYTTDSSEDYITDSTDDFSDITLPDDADNDNYLYPTTTDSTETLRADVDLAITNGLNNALNSYKTELMINPEANLGDFLNVDRVQQSCGDRYALELLDSTTIKCTMEENGTQYIYYALMYIDGAELVVTDVEVLTEEEYLNR